MDNNGDDDYGLDSMKFILERYIDTTNQVFYFNNKSVASNNNDIDNDEKIDSEIINISISVNSASGNPGKIQSGCFLWPGAEKLCNYIVNNWYSTILIDLKKSSCETNKIINVVEVGSGIGLPSLCLSKLLSLSNERYKVTSTDRDANALNILEQNAILNNIELKTVMLDWGSPIIDVDKCDLIVGTDCIFISDITKLLFFTINQLLKMNKDATFILSTSIKMAEEDKLIVTIDECCQLYKLRRTIIYDEIPNGGVRLEYFKRII